MTSFDSSLGQDDRPKGGRTVQDEAGIGPWVKDPASLLVSGKLSERVLQSLREKSKDGDAGSWLDPLFSGPAPVPSLQGLGERYDQLEYLGDGATGTVFKAMDTLLRRWVALKALKFESSHALAEARAQAQVEHPNVCRVYEVGRGFIIMQLVEGPTLASAGSGFDFRTKIACLRDIARGVHAAHQRGLLHLDLKLNNILLHPNGDGSYSPLVGDFGMVLDLHQQSGEDCPMGTPPYSSPEQLAGAPKRVTPASDVYSLAVMAYILICGQSPFDSESIDELLVDIVQTAPVPLELRIPGIPMDIARLIHVCLQKDPKGRCQDAGELAREFDRFLRREPLKIMGMNPSYRVLRFAQRNRIVMLASGLGIFALLVITAGFLWRETRHAQRSDWEYHFQKRVDEARIVLDRAYRRPPHNIQIELSRVRAIEDEIQQQMASQDGIAEGPGHLALGQLLLASDGDVRDAASHFQKAWSSGLRTEGARTWLAFALLRKYQEGIPVPISQGGEIPDAGSGAEQSRYLLHARKMLQTKGDPDQLRLVHMANQVEKEMAMVNSESGASEERIKLALAYRKQVPQDLDALLEECNARLLQLYQDFADGGPGTSEPSAISHWHEARRILEEGLTMAPSYPGIYAKLAILMEFSLDHPFLNPQPRWKVFESYRQWLDQGFLVSPKDPRLLARRINFLSRQACFGLRPSSQVHGDMRNIYRNAGASGNQVLMAILGHILRGSSKGFDFLPLGLAILGTTDGTADDPTLELFSYLLARHSVGEGLDPKPFVRAIGSRFSSNRLWAGPVLEAEYLINAGRKGEVDLRRLDELFARDTRSGQRDEICLLTMAHLRFRVRGTLEAFRELETALATYQKNGKSMDSGPDVTKVILYCVLTLAEGATSLGLDPRPWMERFDLALEERLQRKGLKIQDVKILEARYALTKSRCGLASSGELEKAIAHTDQSVHLLTNRLASHGDALLGPDEPGFGRLMALRGELGIHFARGLKGTRRKVTAQKAGADLTASLRLCPGFKPVLGGLIQEARELQTN